MRQFSYGLILFLFLILPPVAHVLESIMIMHMHMQMPLLLFSGFLMGHLLRTRFPGFFAKWNHNGIPGIVLFSIIFLYWMIPRTMDEALTNPAVEWFKFITLPFLAGIPLRDSWKKIGKLGHHILFVLFTLLCLGMGYLYVNVPVQLCNNYLLIEQIALGWGFLTMAICMILYLIYSFFTDSDSAAPHSAQ